MAIRLIREDERLTCVVSGVTFHYRRMTQHVRQKLRETHTSRGVLDTDAFVDAMLKHCIYTWEGEVCLRDDDASVPFDQQMLLFLPDPIKLELMKIIDSNVDGKVDRRDPS